MGQSPQAPLIPAFMQESLEALAKQQMAKVVHDEKAEWLRTL